MTIRICLVALCIACAGAAGAAEDYPRKAVRMIAPFAPGGATDVLARITSQKLSERWGQSVLVDNRSGASGNVGTDLAARAAPDGYTLLIGGTPNTINVSLYQKLNHDFAKDFVAVNCIATYASAIVVHPSLPVKSVKDLIELARARPGQLTYGSAGAGSPNHLAIELLKTMAKVNMLHVPYKGGSGQMVGDLVAGQVQLASMGLPPSMPYVKGGRLRVIAVTSASRSALLPDAPTVAESGLPGFEVTSWYGIFAPAGTPRDIVIKVNSDLTAVLGAADVKERLSSIGADPAPMTPEAFGQHTRNEIAKWAQVVKASGAKAD